MHQNKKIKKQRSANNVVELYINTHTHTHIYIYTHTHTHTHIYFENIYIRGGHRLIFLI